MWIICVWRWLRSGRGAIGTRNYGRRSVSFNRMIAGANLHMKAADQFMKTAVITPYFETEEDWLTKCHDSVLAQTHPCTHIFVADGAPQDVISRLDAQHIVLGANHDDYGNTPRAIGSASAIGQGFEAIAWLDADNWYEPNHIESLVGLQRKHGAAICTSSRMLYEHNGAPLGLCPTVDGKKFVDTNCYLLTRAAYHLISIWYEMERPLNPVGDVVLWDAVQRSGLSHHHSFAATVAYRTSYRYHYALFEKPFPPGARNIQDMTAAQEFWQECLAARRDA